LAIFADALLAVALALGIWVGPYNELYRSLMEQERRLHDLPAGTIAAEAEQIEEQIEQVYSRLQTPRERARIHMLVGILASLVAVLVNSISVTYFIGTSRWCKEVVATYDLDPAHVAESLKLKRLSFPWSFGGIVLVLTIVILGAAADPGTLRDTTGQWVLPHFIAALFGWALISTSFVVQAMYIGRNTAIVERILSRVREIRVQRGLDVEV
jgi:hypothetical protein